jgi:DNA-binding transcriptional LysR family regulator
MGRAAEILDVSQPTLSRSIQRLEQHYGVALFDRVGRGLRLNDYGRALLAHVERALLELENGERELAQMAGRAQARIALGFLTTFGTTVVPDLIAEFRRVRDDADFRLLQSPAPILAERLAGGDVDLCLTSPRFADASLGWEALWDEELIALVPPGHARAEAGTIDLIDLADEPTIALKPNYGLRRNFDEFARIAGYVPRIVFEGDEVATLVGLVGAGFGVALVPKGVERALGPAVPLRIRTPACFRTIGVSWRRDRYMTPVVARFRDFLIARLRVP